MNIGRPRVDPLARPHWDSGDDRRHRPSLFPEPEDRNRRRASKVRPLDHLSYDERRAVAYLCQGGMMHEIAREYATGTSRWWSKSRGRRDSYAYQAWLYDHRPEVTP